MYYFLISRVQNFTDFKKISFKKTIDNNENQVCLLDLSPLCDDHFSEFTSLNTSITEITKSQQQFTKKQPLQIKKQNKFNKEFKQKYAPKLGTNTQLYQKRFQSKELRDLVPASKDDEIRSHHVDAKQLKNVQLDKFKYNKSIDKAKITQLTQLFSTDLGKQILNYFGGSVRKELNPFQLSEPNYRKWLAIKIVSRNDVKLYTQSIIDDSELLKQLYKKARNKKILGANKKSKIQKFKSFFSNIKAQQSQKIKDSFIEFNKNSRKIGNYRIQQKQYGQKDNASIQQRFSQLLKQKRMNYKHKKNIISAKNVNSQKIDKPKPIRNKQAEFIPKIDKNPTKRQKASKINFSIENSFKNTQTKDKRINKENQINLKYKTVSLEKSAFKKKSQKVMRSFYQVNKIKQKQNSDKSILEKQKISKQFNGQNHHMKLNQPLMKGNETVVSNKKVLRRHIIKK